MNVLVFFSSLVDMHSAKRQERKIHEQENIIVSSRKVIVYSRPIRLRIIEDEASYVFNYN